MALCGYTVDSGKFYVEDYCFSGLPYLTGPNLDACLKNGEDRYVSSSGFTCTVGKGEARKGTRKGEKVIQLL